MPDLSPAVAREPSKSAERNVGRLVFWNPDKKIAFIKPDGGGSDVFAGAREMSRLGNVATGDCIEYALALDHGGRMVGVDLKLLENVK